MAIYKNREVNVIAPTRRINPPQTMQIQYQDGTYETVSMGQITFSKAEKDALVKAYPSEFDNLTVASDDDIKAVRVGVAPASDPSRKEQARAEVRTDEAQKIDQKNKEKVKDEVKDEVNRPQPVTAPNSVMNQKAQAPVSNQNKAK